MSQDLTDIACKTQNWFHGLFKEGTLVGFLQNVAIFWFAFVANKPDHTIFRSEQPGVRAMILPKVLYRISNTIHGNA
jgi:hypothetical protein